MIKKTGKHRRILTAASIILFAFPMISSGQSTGNDWYCPDSEGHAHYMKHLKQFHSKDTSAIVDLLGKIYNDPALNAEQKKTKAVKIIDHYLAKGKLGTGD